MATPIVTEKSIRIMLMDKPELNPLLGGVRWSAEDIDEAIINVIAYFNESAPATGSSYTVETFPFRHCLLIGVAGWMLKAAAVNEANNQFEYSADGMQIQDKNKAPIFAQMGKDYWEEFKTMTRDIKTNQYTSLIFGGNPSEYVRNPTNLW